MRTNKFFLVIFAMSIFLWQCGENPLGAGMENEVEIEILSNRFNPSTVTIASGTKVIWVNKDSKPHSVDPGTLMNPTQVFEGSPNILPNDPPWSKTFTKIETIKYYCSIHQTNVKQGTIIVRQSAFY